MANDDAKEIRFDYIKSNGFRVVHVDGAIGGLTPQGTIHLAFWNQRFAIPQQTTHAVRPDGVLGEERREERVERRAIIREVEVSVLLDLAVARSLREWLDLRIKELEAGPKQMGGAT